MKSLHCSIYSILCEELNEKMNGRVLRRSVPSCIFKKSNCKFQGKTIKTEESFTFLMKIKKVEVLHNIKNRKTLMLDPYARPEIELTVADNHMGQMPLYQIKETLFASVCVYVCACNCKTIFMRTRQRFEASE